MKTLESDAVEMGLARDYQSLVDGTGDVDQVLKKFYSQIYPRILGFVYRELRDREDSEDIAQETMIRIWRSTLNGHSRYKGESKFSVWVYQIAKNRIKNEIIKRTRKGFFVTDSMDVVGEDKDGNPQHYEFDDGRLDPSREYELAELEDSVIAEFDKISPAFREALVLRQVEEKTYEEIAQILRIKLGTVKSRITRAREELRRRVGELV